MSKASTFFKTTAILSTALLSLLGACAIDDPIDYTTDGYTAGPQGGDSGDGGNTGSFNDFVEWTRQLGTFGWDAAYGIATDSSGNVYVTGLGVLSMEPMLAGLISLWSNTTVLEIENGSSNSGLLQMMLLTASLPTAVAMSM